MSGQQVGGLPAALDQHAVAREPERRRAQPDRAIPFVDEIAHAEIGEGLLQLPVLVERHLVRIDVEADAERGERLADLAEHLLLGHLAEDALAGLLGQRVAVARHQVLGDLADVVALVAVAREDHRQAADALGPGRVRISARLRRRRRAAELLEVARAHRLPEHAHLAPAVVEVVLARDAIADGFERLAQMQSPSTAWRPWPSVSGPVGFAETNSTWTCWPAPSCDWP